MNGKQDIQTFKHINTNTYTHKHKYSPAAMIAGLFCGHTDNTLRTLDVVHNNFSYVYDCMILINSIGPLLERIINCGCVCRDYVPIRFHNNNKYDKI